MTKIDRTNRGALFRNADKTADTHADYRGELDVGGQQFWINAWLNTSSKGVKYLSLSVKPKEESSRASAAAKPKPAFDDEIPAAGHRPAHRSDRLHFQIPQSGRRPPRSGRWFAGILAGSDFLWQRHGRSAARLLVPDPQPRRPGAHHAPKLHDRQRQDLASSGTAELHQRKN